MSSMIDPKKPQQTQTMQAPAIIGGNLSRVLPRQMSTGSTRGTQTVGYGNTKIDGSNNSITVGDNILLDGNNDLISIGDAISLDGTTSTISVGDSISLNGDASTITIGDSILLDGENNVIKITNTDGSTVGLGAIPTFTGEFGFFSTDSAGNLIMKIVNGTMYVYDGILDRMQVGILPDASINVAIAKAGDSVSGAFS